MIETLLLISFCAGAAFVQRVSGFGFGIFIMTMLPYLMPSYGEATTLSGLLASVTSIIIVVKMWRFIPWAKLLPILMTFISVSWVAVGLLASMDTRLLKNILGVVLIGASVWFMFLNDRIHVKPTLPMQISMGTLSGFMGGFFGMQGPPAVLYFISSTKTKEEYIAISQMYFLTGNIIMTLFRYNNGFLTHSVCMAWLYGLLAVLVGTWLGTKVYERMSVETLRRVIYIYIGISGVVALM